MADTPEGGVVKEFDDEKREADQFGADPPGSAPRVACTRAGMADMSRTRTCEVVATVRDQKS